MFYTYFILFIIYSFLGWLMEVLLTLYTDKKFINRGFLIGPYYPIYGCGAILLTTLLKNYQDNIFVLFALTFCIFSLLEYITSYLMEKIFNLRWWDYTQMKYNLNGRICLETMLPFSILGVIVIKYVHPFLNNVINQLPENLLSIIAIILITIVILDIIITINITFNIKNVTKNLKKDSTEEIKKAINKFIHNNLYAYNRIIKAFPNMSKIIKEKTRKIKKYKKNPKK